MAEVELGADCSHEQTISGDTGTVKGVYYNDIKLSGITKYGIYVTQAYNGDEATTGVPISNFQLDGISGSVGSSAYSVWVDCGSTSSCSSWYVTYSSFLFLNTLSKYSLFSVPRSTCIMALESINASLLDDTPLTMAQDLDRCLRDWRKGYEVHQRAQCGQELLLKAV